MFIIFQILIALFPIIPLVYIAKRAYQFDITLNKRRNIREKQISFNKIQDFFPNALKQKLENDHTIIKRFANEVIQSYRKFFFSLCIYIICWIIYFAILITRIILVLSNYYKFLEPRKYGCVIGSILMSILILYWFLLTPIFEFFHWYKFANLGYHVWTFLQYATKKIETLFVLITKYLCEIVFSFFPLLAYINTLKFLFILIEVIITFWIALSLLMLYQYMVLKIFSWVLQNIIIFTIRKFNHLHFLKKYTENQILYSLFKNCTYLSMVLVYAVAIDSDNSAAPIAAAIGILFLIDTFFAQEKAIQEKIKNNS